MAWTLRFEQCSSPRIARHKLLRNHTVKTPMTRKATTLCWKKAFPRLFAACQIWISFSLVCVCWKTCYLIKLHNWHLTFHTGSVSWMIFLCNLDESIPKIQHSFQQELRLLFIRKFDKTVWNDRENDGQVKWHQFFNPNQSTINISNEVTLGLRSDDNNIQFESLKRILQSIRS